MNKLLRSLFIPLVLLATSWTMYGQDKSVDMPQFGKQEVQVDGSLNFYDPAGSASGYSGEVNNYKGYYSTMVFTPKTSGNVIRITFKSVDFKDKYSWGPGTHYINIYNGVYNATSNYPTSSHGNSTKFPKGNGFIDQINGSATNKVYTSSAADGSLSVCFDGESCRGAGWTALVQEVKLQPMVVTSSSVTYADVPTKIYNVSKDFELAKLTINTEGGLNPKALTSINVNLEENESLVNPEALKVYVNSELVSGATITNVSGSEYKIALSSNLKEGKNNIEIKADALTSTSFGAKVKLKVASITIDNNNSNLTQSDEPHSAVVEKAILAANGTFSYMVDNEGYAFYDDGGKDGNYNNNVTSTITFKPTDTAKKVKISLSNISIFDTPSSISVDHNDYIKIYDGTEVKESKLIKTIVSDNSAEVVSTDPSGALTIVFVSKNGKPSTGFEGKVTQVVPQNMVVDNVSDLSFGDVSTAYASQKNVPVLGFTINTSNTLNPLELTGVKFSLEGGNAPIVKATLYKSSDKEFGSDVKVATIDINKATGEYTFTSISNVTLSQGDNNFYLTFDIDKLAANDQKVSAKLLSLSFANSSEVTSTLKTPTPITISNVWVTKEGTNTIYVDSNWSFQSDKATYGIYYDASGTTNQIVTFIPTDSKKIIQLKFKELSIGWPTYGNTPIFKVVSGTDPKGTDILFEVNKANSKTVPDDMIRSNSADGAITVVWNPNASRRDRGWNIEVSSYLPRPMAITKIEALQPQAGIVSLKPLPKNVSLMDIDVTTEGDKNPIELNSIKVKIKGAKDIAKLYLYDIKDLNAEPRIPSAIGQVDVADENEVSIPIPRGLMLKEGVNHLRVCFNLKATAKDNDKVDISLVSITQNTVEKAVSTNNDPDGEIVVKNTVNMPADEDPHEVVVDNSGLLFYDNGGAYDRPKDSNGTNQITFKPSTAGNVIKATVQEFDLSWREKFSIYYGSDIDNASPIAGKRDIHDGDVFVSNAADGSMTFTYSNRGDINNSGWAIKIQEYTPKNLSVASVDVSDVSKDKALRSADSRMLKIAVKVAGDKGQLSLSSLEFSSQGTTNMSDIAEANLYYTADKDVFSNTDLFGKASKVGDMFTISGDKTIDQAGTYYLFLEYKVSKDATLSDVLKAKFTKLMVKDVTDGVMPSSEVMASTTVSKGFSGKYIIGDSKDANYPTLKAAFDDMQIGVDGAVTLSIEDGKYEGEVVVPHIDGTSKDNTITITSVSGSPSSVTIFNDHHAYLSYSLDKSLKEPGVITLDSASYVTIKDITVSTTDKDYVAVVRLKNSCHDVTLQNLTLTAPTNDNISAGDVIECYTGSDSYRGFPVNNLVVDGCRITGAGHGISAGCRIGNKGFDDGLIVRNSTFEKQGRIGIYMLGNKNASITNNTINIGEGINSDVKAIDMYVGEGVKVEGNRINVTAEAKSSSGLYIRDVKATAENPLFIANNQIVVDAKNTATPNVISLQARLGGTSNATIVFNTLVSKGNSSSSVFCTQTTRGDITNLVFANNLLQAEAGSIYKTGSYVDGVSFIANAVHTNGSSFALKRGADVSFADWVTFANAQGSVDKEVSFRSTSNLIPTSNEGIQIATNLYNVSTDMLGSKRMNPATVGAYEYSKDIPEVMFRDGFPKFDSATNTSATINVKTDATGTVVFIVKKKGEAAPSLADFDTAKDRFDVRQDMEVACILGSLTRSTAYEAYAITINAIGEKSSSIKKVEFVTNYDPTEPATFETVTDNGDGSFNSGTFKFVNFEAQDTADKGYSPVTKKMAALESGKVGVVTFTNFTNNTQELKGVFVKSQGKSKVTIFGESSSKDVEIPDTNGEWVYFNLMDKGQISKLEFSSEGSLMIDDLDGEPLTFSFVCEDKEAEQGKDVTLSVSNFVGKGVPPYTFEWTQVGRKDFSKQGSSITLNADKLAEYSITGTDAWGRKFTTTTWLKVLGTQYIATFDKYDIPDNTHYFGDLTKVIDVSTGIQTPWYSGSFKMSATAHMSTWWSGMALSREDSKEYRGLGDQFHSAAGGGYDGSKGFMVAYTNFDNVNKIYVTSAKEGAIVKGAYVCSSAYTLNSVTKGDQFSKAFSTGDYLRVIFTATNSKGQTSTTDYYLADYRSPDAKDHYCVDSWQWVDLSGLGAIKTLTFKFDSNVKNQYGITVPTYVCIDNLGDTYKADMMQEKTLAVGKSSIDAASDFGFDMLMGTVRYAIVDKPDDSVLTATISNKGVVTINAKETTSETQYITVRAIQRGKSVYKTYPINISDKTAIDNVEGDNSLQVYPVPANSFIEVSYNKDRYSVDVISLNGSIAISRRDVSGKLRLDVSNLANGVYFVRVNSNGISKVRKVVVSH